MEPIGIVIVVMTLVAFAAGLYLYFGKYRPDSRYRGVGISYQDGAEKNWSGLKETIDLLLDRYPQLMKKVNIEVVPHNGVVLTPSVPDGFVQVINGKTVQAARPHNIHTAKSVMKVAGSIEVQKPLPWKEQYRVPILQKKSQGSSIEHRLGKGRGPIIDARDSALIHEVVAHLLPYSKGDGKNEDHQRKDLVLLEEQLHSELNDRR